MNAAKRFRRSADRLFSLFGNDAVLTVPQGPLVYDNVTGDLTSTVLTYPMKFTPTSVTTNPNSDYGLSAFKGGNVTFYVLDITVVVDETCFITDINGVKWGIQELKNVSVDNITVIYEAELTAHEGA